MPVVELAGVTKAYENKVAVSNLSLSIDAGQMFGLLGPNGAGKTSSIRMMMGITFLTRAGSDSSINHLRAIAWSRSATCPKSAASIKR